jgi:membrane-bound metal-dependent hydrolase YbcI (DUF457 family)
MRRSFARLKGVGFILWHAKHELFHVLLGLMWAWVLRESWQEFNPKWIATVIVGSLLPDIDHLFYFFTYGRKDPYTKTIVTFFKNREWRVLTTFIEKGHKYNTKLYSHNFYVTAILFLLCGMSYWYDWRAAAVLFGAMVSHYLFDIAEDLILLKKVNPNWKRWGRDSS